MVERISKLFKSGTISVLKEPLESSWFQLKMYFFNINHSAYCSDLCTGWRGAAEKSKKFGGIINQWWDEVDMVNMQTQASHGSGQNLCGRI